MTAVVTIDDSNFMLLLGGFPQELYKVVRVELGKTVIELQKKVTQNFDRPGGLNTRSGKLKKSLQTLVKINSTVAADGKMDISASLAGGNQNIKYALIQEKGGTVTAKNKYLGVAGGPYLNIPSNHNKTAAGVMRENAHMVFAAGGYIAGRVVYSAAGLPMFYLVKSVTIPPRLGAIAAAESLVDDLITNINQKMEQVLATP